MLYSVFLQLSDLVSLGLCSQTFCVLPIVLVVGGCGNWARFLLECVCACGRTHMGSWERQKHVVLKGSFVETEKLETQEERTGNPAYQLLDYPIAGLLF